jgi:hypothetical protein
MRRPFFLQVALLIGGKEIVEACVEWSHSSLASKIELSNNILKMLSFSFP